MLARTRFDHRAPAVALALVAISSTPFATAALAAAQESGRDARGWMPDVAERREDLERREALDNVEEERRSLAAEQWWRGAVAAPVQGRLP